MALDPGRLDDGRGSGPDVLGCIYPLRHLGDALHAHAIVSQQAGCLLDAGQSAGWSAGVLASAAAFERDLIRSRTREGLAAKRTRGVRLGRPQRLSTSTVERILTLDLRAQGESLRRIDTQLDEEAVPTAGRQLWLEQRPHRS